MLQGAPERLVLAAVPFVFNIVVAFTQSQKV
jgi:hypothetical protein